MKLTRIYIILALALALASGYYASAQRNNNGNSGFRQRNNNGNFGSAQSSILPPGVTNYDRFPAFISLRNIFNPNRFAVTAPTSVIRDPGPRRQPSTPTFGLVGTMAYEKGMFAFFDGNNSQYQKVLYASDSNYIAGFIVADITTSGVKLQTPDKTQSLTMKIGDSLRQQTDGSWDFGGTSGSFSSPGAAGFGAASSAAGSTASLSTDTGAEPGAAAPSAAPSASVQGNDILKKLMEARQQQLKNEN